MVQYRVKRGDTLPRLSAAFGVPICMICRANKGLSSRGLRLGERIRIPGEDFCCAERGCFVRAGDTVYRLAEKLGCSMYALMEKNGLHGPQELQAGMWISAPCERGVLHTVRAGESLAEIAALYGTSENAIAEENRLTEALYPGMQLMIKKETR